jgi:hypothetical protein
MTAYFIFELKASVEPERIQEKLLSIWDRPGYGWDVDVFHHKKNGTLVCNILYYFSDDPECRERIEKILEYLFGIAVDGHIYYYRFNEAMDMYWKSRQKITLDHLFGEYDPILGGYCLRYEIAQTRLKSCQNKLISQD